MKKYLLMAGVAIVTVSTAMGTPDKSDTTKPGLFQRIFHKKSAVVEPELAELGYAESAESNKVPTPAANEPFDISKIPAPVFPTKATTPVATKATTPVATKTNVKPHLATRTRHFTTKSPSQPKHRHHTVAKKAHSRWWTAAKVAGIVTALVAAGYFGYQYNVVGMAKPAIGNLLRRLPNCVQSAIDKCLGLVNSGFATSAEKAAALAKITCPTANPLTQLVQADAAAKVTAAATEGWNKLGLIGQTWTRLVQGKQAYFNSYSA